MIFFSRYFVSLSKEPHWYCRAYAKYVKEPWKTMPFDQHLFVSCIDPRALLVEGFSTRQWFDTKGEFLSLKAASPVWKFLGKSGLPEVEFPEEFDTSAIGKDLGITLIPQIAAY